MSADLLVRNVAAHWVQSGLPIIATLVTLRLIGKGGPRLRLTLLQSALAAAVVLPLVLPWRTATQAPQSGSLRAVRNAETGRFVLVDFAPGSTSFSANRGFGAREMDLPQVLSAVLLLGIGLRLSWLVAGLVRLRRYRARARAIQKPEVAAELEAVLGVTARYFEHGGHSGPAAFGIFRPTILLPDGFASLDAPTQRAIVCHELLHVKRRDAAATLAEEVMFAALWFHPWIWWLRSHIRLERERVVDGQVVDYLGDSDAYVRSLLTLSGHDRSLDPGAAMVHARHLRSRIDTILSRPEPSRGNSAAVTAVLLAVTGATSLGWWAAPLRAQPRPGADATGHHVRVPAGLLAAGQDSRAGDMPLRRLLKRTPSEYPEEALAKGIGGMAFVDIAVNPAGEVTAAVFVTGPEEFRVAALKTAAALRFEPMPEATAMRVSVNYQIRSDSSNVAISWWNTSGVHTFSTTARSRRGASAVIWEQNAVTRNERVPRKLKHVVPDYPAAAREAGIHGMVILEASVDSQGSVTDTRVVHSIPQLDRAAIDAVSQWQYEPTIVDGTAVPITVTVTVDFMGADLR